ncbi:MAG: ester cyclase [Armatimonadetes bacterium]|nr:ester cyclase [Armatimonadota bacterium]
MDPRIVAIRWMDEVWRQRRIDAIDALHAVDFVDRSPAPEQASDRAACLSGVRAFFEAFPDFEAVTEALIVEGNEVAVRWRTSGTQRGKFLGFAASGGTITFHGIEILRVRNGQIVERWGEWDALSLLEQLRCLHPDQNS